MCLAIPGRIVSIIENKDPLLRFGNVSFNGVLKEVSLAYVPEAKVDDYIIIHVGFALAILEPESLQISED